MKYAAFLAWLVSLGPKIPQAIAHIESAIAELSKLAALFGATTNIGSGGTLSMVEPTAEELALEEQVAQAFSADGTQAVFNPARLRELFQLIEFLSVLFQARFPKPA